MDMLDFYYRQKVLEADLDKILSSAQDAIQAVAVDLDLAARTPTADKSKFGGIASGFTPTHLSGFDIQITAGVAYNQLGEHIATGATFNVNIGKNGFTTTGTGGTPGGEDAISIASGNERYASIYILFDRLEQDPRYDGYDDLVYFDQPESFQFHVEYGAEATAGSATPAARKDEEVLICDVLCENTGSGAQVKSAGVDTDRKEIYVRLEKTNYTITAVNIRDAIEDLMDNMEDHLAGGTKHPASDITWASSALWADGTAGTANTATNVDDALDGIIADLSAKYAAGGGVSGAARIGVEASSGSTRSGLTGPTGNLLELQNTDIQTQLEALRDAVNNRIFAGGDDDCRSLIPGTANQFLGQYGDPWGTAYIDKIYVRADAGYGFYGDMTPMQMGSFDLGNTTYHWSDLYINDIKIDTDDTYWHCLDITADSGSIASEPGFKLMVKDDVTDTRIIMLANPNGLAAALESNASVMFGYGQYSAGAEPTKFVGVELEAGNPGTDQFFTRIGDIKSTTPTMSALYKSDKLGGTNKAEFTLGGTVASYHIPTQTGQKVYCGIIPLPQNMGASTGWHYYCTDLINPPDIGANQTYYYADATSRVLYFNIVDWPEDMTLTNIEFDCKASTASISSVGFSFMCVRVTWPSESGQAETRSYLNPSALQTTNNIVRHWKSYAVSIGNAYWSHQSDQLLVMMVSNDVLLGDILYGVRLTVNYDTVSTYNPPANIA